MLQQRYKHDLVGWRLIPLSITIIHHNKPTKRIFVMLRLKLTKVMGDRRSNRISFNSSLITPLYLKRLKSGKGVTPMRCISNKAISTGDFMKL